MTQTSLTSRRAFTLTEALVAVVAIAIISVGLAAIFASVGDTVQRGQRISSINQYAASIERRIRADLSNLTRDGFLVIRNEYAGSSNANAADQLIPLSPDEPGSARLRRVDELMFFARGSFVSARGSIAPEFDTPRSREARIYYGHGQKQLEGADGFFRPYLNDPNVDPGGDPNADTDLGLGVRSGIAADIGDANPNVFAGDWTLLRHATLLRQPALPFDPNGTSTPDRFDNNLQINGQIAADSIFRSEAFWGEPFRDGNPLNDEFADNSLRFAEVAPTFPSGTVDVATQTLADIRRRVQGLAVRVNTNSFTPGGGGGSEFWVETPDVEFAIGARGGRLESERISGGANGTRIGRPTAASVLYALQLERFTDADTSNDNLIVPAESRQSLVHLQHAWMSDALPAGSNELTYVPSTPNVDVIPDADDLEVVFRDVPINGGTTPSFAGVADPVYPTRSRMRYESVPPGYNADVFGPDVQDQFRSDPALGAVLLAAARADQQMVTNSQFIPRCTEFIVEWSFGERYVASIAGQPGTVVDAIWTGDPSDIAGELIWYGLPRPAADGVPIASLRPLRSVPAGSLPEVLDEPTETPADAGTFTQLSLPEQRLLEQHLRAELILGDADDLEPTQLAPRASLTAFRQTEPDPRPLDASGGSNDGIERTAAEAPATFYFGYGDPRAVPVDDFVNPTDPTQVILNRGFDINGDGFRDDLDGDGVYDESWPWPRLIRITMSFADPVDQTVEDTFQFVVELPREGDL